MHLAVRKRVIELLQGQASSRALVGECPAWFTSKIDRFNMPTAGAVRFMSLGLIRTPSFHGLEDVMLTAHLHHSPIDSAHGRHDAVRADGHEAEQFQKSRFRRPLKEGDDDGTGDRNDSKNLVELCRGEESARSCCWQSENGPYDL